jgi:ppGpp synthetase/RelA/SpoT-type nucleotidyltranferase
MRRGAPRSRIDPLPALLEERLPEDIRSEEGFARWFEPWRERVMVAVLAVHEAVIQRLEEERRRLCAAERVHRQVWEVTGTDGRSLLKSTASARSKIGRELQDRQRAGRLHAGRLSIEEVEQILLGFPDLGRFRIVCDFSCDVETARRCLLAGKPPRLLGRYAMAGRIKDYSNDPALRRPTRGHRAVQFAIQVPDGDHGRSFLIEIQLMTQLQAAWDLRNHPIYEWSREGGRLPVKLALRDVALAEALYLVDLQATANWRSFVRQCRPRRERP